MELRSTIRLVSDGTVEWVDLTFEIHPEDDLHVYFDGDRVEQGWTLMQESTPQRVVFDEPIPDGVDVIIRRASDLSEIPHVFHYTGNIKGGAEFNAKNMDENFAKILRASEDAMDSFELVGVNIEAAVDANLAADRAEAAAEDAEQSYQNTLAYDQQGEMWKNQAKGYAEDAQGYLAVVESDANRAEAAANAAEASELSAQAARNDAVGAAAAAETSENNAAGSASAAQTYAQSAQSQANAALNHAETAESYKQDAASSASAASQSASNAAGSAGAAQTARNVAEAHRDKAKEWASNPEDVVVQDGQYSAYHWAKKAEGFVGGSEFLRIGNNLSEVDPEEARNNLGLGSAATRDVGAGADEVPTNSNLGSAATRDVVSSESDTSGGDKVVTQGWMGLGNPAKVRLNDGDDLNNITSVNRFFSWSNASILNNPTNNKWGAGFTFGWAHNEGLTQIAWGSGGEKWYVRQRNNANDSWSPWREIYHTGNKPSWGDISGKPSSFNPSSHNHSASNITSGTLNGSRLPTGAGGVGTYAFVVGANSSSNRSWSWGDTAPGSQLARANIRPDGGIGFSGTLSGTWRIVSAGVANDQSGFNTNKRAGLAVRIS